MTACLREFTYFPSHQDGVMARRAVPVTLLEILRCRTSVSQFYAAQSRIATALRRLFLRSSLVWRQMRD